LQEFILDDLCNLKSCLLQLIERVLTDQLHDFNKIVLFLKNCLNLCFVSHELRISLIVILLQGLVVV
jgi:hypothetical protein